MATFFNKQVILINNDDDLCALADARTEERISDWFIDIEEFDKQFVKVTKYDEDDNECYALVNQQGKVMTDWFVDIDKFDNQFIKATKYDEYDNECYALVNQQGKVVTDWFVDIDKFDNQFYKATKYDAEDNETYALINQQGNLMTDWFIDIDDFRDGIAEVTKYNDAGDEVYALINKNGKVISKWYDDDSDFDDLRDAKQGLANENIEEVKEQQQQAMSAPSVPSKETEKNHVLSQNKTPNNTHNNMYNEQLENLIDAALADGVLTEKEKQILFKKAQALGVDLDEFEMVLDARLVNLQKAEQEKAASSAPKSNKLGDVKKCPSCGAMVQSFQGVCPECGYAFEGVDANSAIKELSNLLQRESGIGKMERIIDSFPIPMDKATLLAFLTWLRPQSVDTKNPLANSYFKKYVECVNKIKVSFSDDKDLQRFITFVVEDEKKIKRQKLLNSTIKNKYFWIGVVIFVILLLLFKPNLKTDSENASAAIMKALQKENVEKACDIFIEFENKYRLRDLPTESLIKACLELENFKMAEQILEKSKLSVPVQKPLPPYEKYLYDYCMKHGEFEKTKKYIYFDDHDWYVKDVVVYLCEQGEKDKAQKFLNVHSTNKAFTKKIQDIIDKY